MRKNSRIITLAVAAAVMMAVTACGSKDKTETTASTEATTEAVTTTGTETTASEAESTEEEDQAEEEEMDEADEAAEETTASAAGEIGSAGVFKAANGKFEIKVPADWTIDEGSDDEYVTFLSASGDDMLEIMTISGSSADSIREIYPDTAEEYKNMVSRGDDMKILSYDVKTKDDGSQTFQYSMKYTNPNDGIHYLAESGSYDAAKQTYSCATGTVMSTDEAVSKQVEEAVKSFKIK